MKIHFLGAARTVTGSCYVIESANSRFAVDCGMHQGNSEIDKRNEDMTPYEFDKLDFILITHAHIDHTGLLPRAVKFGFKGPVYVTPPTADLLEIMLLDSAHIQEMEAEWENRKRSRYGKKPLEPLYTQGDAQAVTKLFKTVNYNEPLTPAKGVSAVFHDAGHILGSSFIELTVAENGDSTKLVFSGDLGRPHQLLVRDPSILQTADYLLLESTYGDRNHKDPGDSRAELAEAIAYSYERGEKVIIPAFAVERTQEIIYTLHSLAKEGKLPKDMPVYLDSPLAIRATKIFREHPEFMDQDARALIGNGEDPLSLPNLVFTPSVDESKAINESRRPAVVISASGMCNAGRIKHHLKHNLWRPGASVVFVGYQAVGTPGRKIVDGVKRINIFGESVAVKAKIFTIGGFSAHAGQSQILDWLANFKSEAMKIFLVHGEAKAQDILAGLIKERFGYTVHIPDYLEECELKPGLAPAIALHPEKARPRIDWEYLLAETERLLTELKKRQGDVTAKAWVDQTELRDRLLKINAEILELNSEL